MQLGIVDTDADRDADLVGIPLRRTVEGIGVQRLYGAVRLHLRAAVEVVAVVEARHPRPAEKHVEDPPLAEIPFVARTSTEHESVAFAVTVFEVDAPVLDVGFRHAESHHARIAAHVPAPGITAEVVAVFVQEDAEVHRFALPVDVDRFPRRIDELRLEGGVVGQPELYGRVDDSYECVEAVEFRVDLCVGRCGTEQRGEQEQRRDTETFHLR